MTLIVEFILWFIFEVVFWGIMYWTGYFLAQAISIGQWSPGHVGADKEERKDIKFIFTALIGALFWIGFVIAFVVVVQA